MSEAVVIASIAAGPGILAALIGALVPSRRLIERMVRVETKIDDQGKRLERVETKLDRR